jgi:acyl dehydratase
MAKFVKQDILGEQLLAGKSFKVEWVSPVLANDILHSKVVINNLTVRSAFNGIVEVKITIYNQEDKMVMDTLTEAIVERNN